MTTLGKFSVATLILGSAILTAKYLHPEASPTGPAPSSPPPRRQLSWQARSTQTMPTPGLTKVGSGVSAPPAAPSVAPTPRPQAFDAQVSFAAFSPAATAPTAAPPAAGSAVPALPTLTAAASNSASSSGRLELPTPRHDKAVTISVLEPTASPRPPIPLAIAPQSDLSQVQRHESTGAQATANFVEHTVQFGETLPILAAKYLGDREAYLSIYAANLDVLKRPTDVTPGLVLKIPVHR